MSEQPYDVFSTHCPSRETLEVVTGRWGTLTLAALAGSDEPLRFGELRRRIEGVSEKMLSQTLKALESDGLVVRTVHSTLPARVDYRLTDPGRRVALAVTALVAAVYEVQPGLPS